MFPRHTCKETSIHLNNNKKKIFKKQSKATKPGRCYSLSVRGRSDGWMEVHTHGSEARAPLTLTRSTHSHSLSFWLYPVLPAKVQQGDTFQALRRCLTNSQTQIRPCFLFLVLPSCPFLSFPSFLEKITYNQLGERWLLAPRRPRQGD